jgi:hypothetical protein
LTEKTKSINIRICEIQKSKPNPVGDAGKKNPSLIFIDWAVDILAGVRNATGPGAGSKPQKDITWRTGSEKEP